MKSIFTKVQVIVVLILLQTFNVHGQFLLNGSAQNHADLTTVATGQNGNNYSASKIFATPGVLSITRQNLNPTNLGSVIFQVSFSEDVTGVDAGDFSLTTTGVSGTSVTGVTAVVGTSVYNVSVNTGSGDGTIRLDFFSNGSVQSVSTSDPTVADFTNGETYDIDKTPPFVTNITRANANPTNASSVDFTVNFSESVTGVDMTDFSLTTTGVTGASITGVSGSGSAYTVSVNTGSGSGTIRLDFVNDGSVTDASGNTTTTTFTTGEAYTIDRVAGTISGDQTICSGGPATLTFTATGLGTATITYQDVFNNVQANVYTVTGAADGSPFTATVNSLIAGTHTFTIISTQDDVGTTTGGTGTATVIVNQTLTAAFAGTPSQTVCAGGAASLTVNITGGAGVYTLTYTSAGTSTSVAVNGNTYTITAPANAGTYTYTLQSVQDQNTLCSSTSNGTGTITVNPLPTATFAGTTSTTICSGSTTTLTILLTGSGTYTLTYQVTNGGITTATTVTVTGNTYSITAPPSSAPGTFTYTITNVTDANGCSNTGANTAAVTMNDPPSVTVSESPGPPYQAIFNIQDLNYGLQSIIVTQSENADTVVPPFIPGTTDPVTVTSTKIDQSHPLNVSFIVTDMAGCSKTFTFSDVATISGDQSICSGGSATLTFNVNGAGNVTITYRDALGGAVYTVTGTQAGSPFTSVVGPLTAGTHTFTIVSSQDQNGTYTGSGSAVVLVNSLPTATFSGTTSQTVCSGTTATLTVALTGSGNYTVTYQVSNGSTVTATTVTVTGNTMTITAPPSNTAGTYTYTITSVTDGNGCSNTGSGTATVTVNTLPAAVIGGTSTVCIGSAGTLTFTLTGTGVITVTYINSAGQSGTFTATAGTFSRSVVTPTTAGTFTYTITNVTDANGCSSVGTGVGTVTVTQPTATINGMSIVTSTLGAGDALMPSRLFRNGVASTCGVSKLFPGVSNTGYPGPFYYETYTYNNTTAFAQCVSITYARTSGTGQPFVSAYLNSFNPMNLASNYLADGGGGTSGGTLTFSFTLAPNSSVVLVVNESSTTGNQGAGYTMTVSGLPAMANAMTVCYGSPSPQIVFEGAAGTKSYTFGYRINGGTVTTVNTSGGNSTATVSVPTNVAGTFTYTLVSVQDASGCIQSYGGTVTVVVLNPFTLSAVASQNPILCNPGSTTITVTPTGGVGTVTYTLMGPGGTTTVTVTAPGAAVFPNIGAGNYTVTAVNGNPEACGASTTLTVTQLPPITATLGTVNVSCFGFSNGSVNVFNVSGGTPTYTFSKDGTNYIQAPPSGPTFPGLSFNGLTANIYNIYAKDANGCVNVLGTATIIQPPLLVISSVGQGPAVTCASGTTSLTVNTLGGTGTDTYSLDGGAPQASNTFLTGIGQHTILVTDAAGCTTSTTVTVSGASALTITTTSVVNNTCFNGISGQIGVRASGGTGTITYTLTKPGGATSQLSGAQGSTVTFTGLSAGNYTATATDGSSCAATTAVTVTQPAMSAPIQNTNGTPDLLLTSVINPPTGSFPTPGSQVTITYTISIKNNGNISAQGVILRVTKPFSGFTIQLAPGSTGMWTQTADNPSYTEFTLNAGFEIACSGNQQATIVISRNGSVGTSAGAPITGSVRLGGANQDLNDFDNARASQFRIQ